jgi:hypothetical protein
MSPNSTSSSNKESSAAKGYGGKLDAGRGVQVQVSAKTVESILLASQVVPSLSGVESNQAETANNTMKELLRISDSTIKSESNHKLYLESELVQEMTMRVQDAGGKIYHEFVLSAKEKLNLGWVPPTEVIIGLGSAGVFTALYQTISSYLTRNQNRELTLEKGNIKITIKGHSLPEETELLKKLAPELLPAGEKKKRKKKVSKQS